MSIKLKPLQRQSIWCAAASPLHPSSSAGSDTKPCRSLNETLHQEVVDVVVVGGGLAGLSAAYHLLLAQPGLRVVVLESHAIGYGASTRNSGMLTPGIGQSLAALVKRFGLDQARAMYLTSLAAVNYFEELSEHEEMDFGLRWTGQLVVARGRAGRHRLAQQAALMKRLELPCRTLNDAELARRVCIRLDAAGTGPAALQLPMAGVLDPARLVSNLALAVQRLGGTIVENAMVEEVTTSGVNLTGGRAVRAAKVVLATNAYDLSLGLQRGRLMPLHLRMIATRRLTTGELDVLGWQHREGIIDSRRVFNYFRLTDDHRLLLGGGAPRYQWRGAVQDLEPMGPDVGRLIADFRQLFPQLAQVDVERTWTGAIAYSIDTLPVIGPVAHLPNAIQVGGWCGHGIALSVYSGRWVSDLILGTSATGKGATSNLAGNDFGQPWFRAQAPRIPTEVARWCGIKLGAWSTQMLDHLV